jgi:CubicO group peptidase (beta-lactamase class C family)
MNRIVRIFPLIGVALCLIASITWAAPAPAASSEPDYAAIDAYIETQMKGARIPGLALGIVHDSEVVYLKGYGRAGPSGQPVTPQTPFMLASVIKPLTGLAVMQLVEAGKIDLDAPVQRYLPWFHLADTNASSPDETSPDETSPITVRHLLNHTSGIPRPTGSEYSLRGDYRPDALEQHVRALSAVAPAHPVGTTYEYANLGYQVLGLLIEQVSGLSYAAYLQEYVLDPLEMRQTFTSSKEGQLHGLATGYRYWFGRPMPANLPVDEGGLPSGTVASSSAEDMTHFLIAQLNGGRYGEATVLSPEGIAEMQRPVAPEGESDLFYAMDWSVTNVSGRQWVIKGGDLPDFKTQLILIPEARWGVVILINANNLLASGLLGDLRIPGIGMGVGNLLVGQQPVEAAGSRVWIFNGVILLVAALQLAGVIRSVVVLRRWRGQLDHRPRGLWRQAWQIGGPLFLSLAWGLFTLVGVPQVLGYPLSFLLYLTPDLGYSLLLSGTVALVWGLVHAGLAFFLLRTSRASAPVSTETLLASK